jgi:hypothetical protein
MDQAERMGAMRWSSLCVLALAGSALSCGSDATQTKGDVDQFLSDARQLVHVDGCATSSACGVAAVGVKGCGGPREYWVYCRATTNEAALLQTLERERQLEVLYNEQTHAVSDCLFLTPPTPLVVNGRCEAGAALPQ